MNDAEIFSALSEAGEFQTEGSIACKLKSIRLLKTCVDNLVFPLAGAKASSVADEVPKIPIARI
ncbi:MAG: hypothetical protein P4M11_10305 [Candidatus Pacebacteria bacterium]|nr:hypothetical protein [Candidatus Paceibacterota bacterium]